jgi:hypothetical protein
MVCGNCGASIADKAIVCYRCGTPTSVPVAPARPGPASGSRPVLAALMVLVALALGWFGIAAVRGSDLTHLMMVRATASLVLAALLFFLAARLFLRRRR